MNELKFNKVGAGGPMRKICLCLAVVRVHAELPKDENGVGTYTIRQLLEAVDETKMVDPVLKEYVCAFGIHGDKVLMKAASIHKFEWEELAPVYNDYVTKLHTYMRQNPVTR